MKSKIALFFEGQVLHFTGLLLLLCALYFAVQTTEMQQGSFLGLQTTDWIVLAAGNAIAHQVYVWLCWRWELYSQGVTSTFGEKAFLLYKIVFSILIILRPVLAFLLGWSNRGSLDINPWVGYGVSLVLFLPAIYMMYSVVHFFTFNRAFGIDHFDASYRKAPLVRDGIFKWTPNAMYVFGFFILWVPAFLFQSQAALVAAAFSHVYIWIHYFATEKPDMKRIYG
ncbi:MAG: phosphatidylethanolamine N-methyltransferase family protein [Rhodospirillales bacterium]|nr:phosphatidylethanolamine N-methyltransferase family protein [Rhodospirillales bacterium]